MTAILPAQVGSRGPFAAYDRGMRSLLTLSIILLVAGLSLGLLNFYIDGRLSAALLFGSIGAVVGLVASAAIIISRR